MILLVIRFFQILSLDLRYLCHHITIYSYTHIYYIHTSFYICKYIVVNKSYFNINYKLFMKSDIKHILTCWLIGYFPRRKFCSINIIFGKYIQVLQIPKTWYFEEIQSISTQWHVYLNIFCWLIFFKQKYFHILVSVIFVSDSKNSNGLS